MSEYPVVEKIVPTEKTESSLIYCKIGEFSIAESGALLLIDDCGNTAYCPADRFSIKIGGSRIKIYVKTKMTEKPKGCMDCDECTIYNNSFIRCRPKQAVIGAYPDRFCSQMERPSWCPLRTEQEIADKAKENK